MPAPAVAAVAKWAAQRYAKKKIASGHGGRNAALGGGAVFATGMFVLVIVTGLIGAVGGVLGALGSLTAGGAGFAAANSCTTSVDYTTTGAPSNASTFALQDIPPVAMKAYLNAAQQSGIDWTYIAGIGRVESDHGRFGGRHLDNNGDVQPTPILGIPTRYGRAEGPMQFLSSTWASDGRDGNNDGNKNAQNIFDAALTTGFYLKAAGGPGNMHDAIFSYNHAEWYVQEVLGWASKYTAAPTNTSTASASGTIRATTGSGTSTLSLSSYLAPARPAATPPSSPAPTAQWVQPMKPGTYHNTAVFDQAGSYWSGGFGVPSGHHTGYDYAAPIGTPVYAIGAGTIRYDPSQAGWAGPNLLLVDHGTIGSLGGDVVSWYAHLSRRANGIHDGQHVAAGQLIGYVGDLGNVTGPHLHLQVVINGRAIDPKAFLDGKGAPSGIGDTASDGCGPQGTSGIVDGNGAWGGYQNGRIPLSAMCQLDFSPAYLECNAAKSLDLLNAAYEKHFHTNVGPVGGYRSYAEQVVCRQQKGNLCAVPGTSNHGWGLAVDLAGGGINNFGTPQHDWMLKNAPTFGWVHPSWAEPNGSKPEPWHWEYTPTGNQAPAPNAAPYL